MLYFWSILLILLNAIWLVLTFFALPGNWLIVISTCLFAWWRAEDNIFSIYTLLGIAVLAIAGELVEFFGGIGGAKRKGASRRGSMGAIVGIAGKFIIGVIICFIVAIAAFWP